MNKYNDIKLIGLCGGAGVGKDTIADLVLDTYQKMAYADSLKQICIEFLGLNKDDVYTQEGKMKFNEFWNMTNREILQKVGTDCFRNNFDKDTWVKIMQLKLKKELSLNKKIIITDCRFNNEAQLIYKLGGVVFKVVRPNLKTNLTQQEKNHISEQGIDKKYISCEILNDNTIDSLKYEFKGKIDDFEKKHSHIIDEISNLVNNNKLNNIFAQQIVLLLKRFITININNVFLRGEKGLQFEWINLNNFNYILTVIDDNAEFNIINKKNNGNYKISFKINDLFNWNKINNLLKKE